MPNTISRRLQLVTLFLIVMMGAYGVFMYYSAKQADMATDLRNEKLVAGLFASHSNGINNIAARTSVSDIYYRSILSNTISIELDRKCQSSNNDGIGVSFGVFGKRSGLNFLCEYGESKPVEEYGYLQDLVVEKSSRLLSQVEKITEKGFLPAGEFIHEKGYFEFKNLPYYYVVSAMVPESDTKQIANENYFFFALHNLRGKVRQISSDFLPILHIGAEKVAEVNKNVFASVISAGNDSGVRIGWPRSTSYRDQFFTLMPIVLSGILLFTFVIWRNISKISTLHNELARREEQARFSASHDGMTGLTNRQYFEVKVFSLLEEMFGKRKIFVGLLDLDKFKSVNDTYGHQTGDELIKAAASRLAEIMGAENLAARLGGDEFAFAFCEDTLDAAQLRMHDLLEKLKKDVEFEGTILAPSASIGVCEAVPGFNNREVLMKLADQALYNVKRNGRGGIMFYQHDMSDDILERLN